MPPLSRRAELGRARVPRAMTGKRRIATRITKMAAVAARPMSMTMATATAARSRFAPVTIVAASDQKRNLSTLHCSHRRRVVAARQVAALGRRQTMRFAQSAKMGIGTGDDGVGCGHGCPYRNARAPCRCQTRRRESAGRDVPTRCSARIRHRAQQPVDVDRTRRVRGALNIAYTAGSLSSVGHRGRAFTGT